MKPAQNLGPKVEYLCSTVNLYPNLYRSIPRP